MIKMGNVQAAVKGLIVKNGKFLAVKQRLESFSVWDLPGGRIEYGSDPVSCLKREVKEETDLDINVGKPIGTWYFFRENDKDQVILMTFLCEPLSDRVDLSKNVDDEENLTEYKWVSPEDFLSDGFKTGHRSFKAMIKDYFKIK